MGLLSSLSRALARVDERIDGAEQLARGAVASLHELAQQTKLRTDIEASNAASMALNDLTWEPYRSNKDEPISSREVAIQRLRQRLALHRFAAAGVEVPPELRPT